MYVFNLEPWTHLIIAPTAIRGGVTGLEPGAVPSPCPATRFHSFSSGQGSDVEVRATRVRWGLILVVADAVVRESDKRTVGSMIGYPHVGEGEARRLRAASSN